MIAAFPSSVAVGCTLSQSSVVGWLPATPCLEADVSLGPLVG